MYHILYILIVILVGFLVLVLVVTKTSNTNSIIYIVSLGFRFDIEWTSNGYLHGS